MLNSRCGTALVAACLYGFVAAPAWAGDGQVASGPDGRAGRYGGGFIEFLMTGQSGPAQPYAPSSPMPRPARAYVASAAQGAGAGYDYGQPVADPYAGQAGYEAARKPMDPRFVRQEVAYDGPQPAGTVVVDTSRKFLYLVEGSGHALRYGVGVGKPDFLWHGEKTITRKAEWPGWTPPAEMMQRRPDLPAHMDGGIANPLGARAMYLGSSLYRIHGTNEPDTIGTNVSSGCIRLTNEDVEDLFNRVRVGTKVIVM